MEAKEQGELVLPASEGDRQEQSIPEFTRDNITETAMQMFPGSRVVWGKGYNGKPKMTVLLYGEGEPGDLCPFHIQGGDLMQIAKTLVTVFGCCQHLVIKMLSQEMGDTKKEEDAKLVLPGQESE